MAGFDWGSAVAAGVTAAAGLLGNYFNNKASEKASKENALRELKLQELKYKYGLAGGAGGGGGAPAGPMGPTLWDIYREQLSNTTAATDRQMKAMQDLAVLTQNPLLRG